MPTVHLTEANFKSTVESGLVFLDFWAAWCGPCRSFAPIFEEASHRHPDFVFAKIDTDANQEIAGTFGVETIGQVRDRLLAIGFDLSKYSSELAAIHTVLKRLNEAGELRFLVGGPKQGAYLWNRPATVIALGPEIAELIRGGGSPARRPTVRKRPKA